MKNKKIKMFEEKKKIHDTEKKNYINMKIKNELKNDENKQKKYFQIFWLKNDFL